MITTATAINNDVVEKNDVDIGGTVHQTAMTTEWTVNQTAMEVISTNNRSPASLTGEAMFNLPGDCPPPPPPNPVWEMKRGTFDILTSRMKAV